MSLRTSKKAQEVKTLDTKLNGLSLSPGTLTWKLRNVR